MADWSEVYEDAGVLRDARGRVARYLTGYALLSGAALSLGPLGAVHAPEAGLWFALAAGALLAGGAVWLLLRLRHVQRLTWCLRLSVHRLVGIGQGHRAVTMRWSDVERVDVDASGLTIAGRAGKRICHLHVPAAFPAFAHLSHRVYAYAEAHGCLVCVDGQPWQHLDLNMVYPYLQQELTVAGVPGRRA